MHSHFFKILIIGNSLTGKSSLLHAFTDNTFSEHYSRHGLAFRNKTIVVDGQDIKLQIWDVGLEYSSDISLLYHSIHGVILTFDLRNQQSFAAINHWVQHIRQYSPEKTPIILVGTHCDLFSAHVIDIDEINNLSKQLTIPYIETSAKNSLHIDEPFLKLTELILAKQNQQQSCSITSNKYYSSHQRYESFPSLTNEKNTSTKLPPKTKVNHLYSSIIITKPKNDSDFAIENLICTTQFLKIIIERIPLPDTLLDAIRTAKSTLKKDTINDMVLEMNTIITNIIKQLSTNTIDTQKKEPIIQQLMIVNSLLATKLSSQLFKSMVNDAEQACLQVLPENDNYRDFGNTLV